MEGRLLLDAGVSVSYPDGTQGPDGTIYVTCGNEGATEGKILMAQFTEEDVLAGKFTCPQSAQRILVSRALGITLVLEEQRQQKEDLKKQKADEQKNAVAVPAK